MNHARIDGLAGPGDGLEEKIVASNLIEHEAAILIEPCRRVDRPLQIALAKLARGSGHEIVDALLRVEALVNVIVSGVDDVHAVSDEQGL